MRTGYPSVDKPWLALYKLKDSGELKWPECTMHEYMRLTGSEYPEDPALICDERKISFTALTAGIMETADALLAAGIQKGDVVMIVLSSVPEAVFLIYAIGSIGAVCDILAPSSDADTLSYHLNETSPKMVFYDPRKRKDFFGVIKNAGSVPVEVRRDESRLFPPSGGKGILTWHGFLAKGKGAEALRLQAMAAVSQDDVALIIHTSGSTNETKPVMLTHRNLNSFVFFHRLPRRGYGIKRGTAPCPNSLHTAAGLSATLLIPLCSGWTSVLLPDYRPKDLAETVEKYRSSLITCNANALEMMIASGKKYDFSFVKRVMIGGEPLSLELEKRVIAYLESCGAKVALYNSYGMTETCGAFCTAPSGYYVPGSVGIPMVGINMSVFDPETGKELRFGEEGELCITGPIVMKGYFGQPDETAKMLRRHEDGNIWLHTGDLGYMNEDGGVFVLDRVSRGMDVGGKKVYPGKTQRTLSGFSSIIKCAVTGKGGKLMAYIVPAPEITQEKWPDFITAMKDYVASALPPEERPENYVYLDLLPTLPSGKINLRALSSMGELMTKIQQPAPRSESKK